MIRQTQTTWLSHITPAAAAQAVFDLPYTAFKALCRAQARHEERLHVQGLDARLLDDAGLTSAKAQKAFGLE